ncbi:MAG: type I-D CRISPR-associated protein Cas5/Csc1 [Brevinematia bacterium]|jgi:CRISPR type I-D-associated protein Csc1
MNNKLPELRETAGSRIYRVLAVSHDFLFFASRGIRKISTTKFIGNYALMYSLNRHVVEVQRNISGTKPHYEEDIKKFTIYATPAKLVNTNELLLCYEYGLPKKIRWETSTQQVVITYNAVNTLTNNVETSRLNFPMVGKYTKNVPLSVFEFFTIGGNPNGIFRLGKKLAIVRYFAEPLKLIKTHEKERVVSNHPVNIIELPKDANIVSGIILNQVPPLIINATLENVTWLECEDGTSKYNIVLPSTSLYPGVKWP